MNLKKLKKQSADGLKASAIIPTEHDLALTIVSTSEKSLTLSNGALKKRADFVESEIYRSIKGNLKKNSAYLSKHDDLVNKFMTTPKNITFNHDSIPNIIAMATSIEEHKAAYKKHMLIHIAEFIETMKEIDISETVSTEDSEGNYLEAPFTKTMKAKERIKIGDRFQDSTKKEFKSTCKHEYRCHHNS